MSSFTSQFTANMEAEKIMLFFSAINLPVMKGATDAFAYIYSRHRQTGALSILGSTETVFDNSRPNWTTNITVDYLFQEIQEIVVRVWHKNPKFPADPASTAPGSSVHTYLGEASFTESALMMSPGCKMQFPLLSGVMGGSIIVRGDAVAQTRDILTCSFQLQDLTRKNGWGVFAKSDPYIQISRKFADGSYASVWRSAYMENNLNPLFSNLRIPMQALCNGNLAAELNIEVLDYDPEGNHKSMGAFNCTMRDLLENSGRPFTLIEKTRVGTFMYSNSGSFRCLNAKVEKHHTLGQYVMGGLNIFMNVCIDFTASNGNPSERKSLHRFGNPGEPMNDYEKAITSVASVIEAYSTTKQFSVYGFGAKIKMPDGSLSDTQHCFPIYGGESIVHGAAGVIKAYHDCLGAVSLSGPTYFAPLIDNAAYVSATKGCTQANQNYYIMLILTDGVIDDKNETIQSIIRAADTPLSVIIIGIGNEDFTDMTTLDGDSKLLQQGGASASRDIVQFVPFNKFLQKGPVALAQSVLAEVPSQLLKYMENHKLVPNEAAPPPAYSD